jgi:hypothetical protein
MRRLASFRQFAQAERHGRQDAGFWRRKETASPLLLGRLITVTDTAA